MPAVYFYGQYDLQKRWLACMRLTFYPMVFMLVGSAFHILLCLTFAIWLDYGIIGLGIAMTIRDFSLMAMTWIYGNCSSKVRHILMPYDREALRGWGEYLSISLPATAMLCAEWWALEVLAILAGILGVIQLASQIINFNMISILLTTSLGVQ